MPKTAPKTAEAIDVPAFRSHPVTTPFSVQSRPGRHRIGLVTLASDYTIERDFTNMRPSDDVAVYVSRVLNVNPCTIENLRTMAPRITDSAALILPDGHIDVVAYGCTSATVAIGFDQVASAIRAARPGVPCTTPITAALAGFARLEVNRVAVLTPYQDNVNAAIAGYLEANGIEVVRFTSFGIADDNDMPGLSPEVIHAAALEADAPNAQALFISCTALRAVEVIEKIEAELDKPVLSANQALFWEALRKSGWTEPVPGYGRLLDL